MDDVSARARADVGITESANIVPKLAMNYWVNFTVDRYFDDLVPAAENMGLRAIFVDNLHESDYTKFSGYPTANNSVPWDNMCGGQEYELAPQVGGPDGVKGFTRRCNASRIRPYSWTNNDQSRLSPNWEMSADTDDWFIRSWNVDKLRWGGSYTDTLAAWNFANPAPRNYWVESLRRDCEVSGLCAYLLDSFFNLEYMPVDFRRGHPTTMWRQQLQAVAELQASGLHFMMESLGPWVESQVNPMNQGYSLANLFAVYRTVINPAPSPQVYFTPAEYYRILAHMVNPPHPLFVKTEGGPSHRLDAVFTAQHKRALQDFYAVQDRMFWRYLQQDDASVQWRSSNGSLLTVWNFARRTASLPCTGLFDVTEGARVPVDPSGNVTLADMHTYTCSSADSVSI